MAWLSYGGALWQPAAHMANAAPILRVSPMTSLLADYQPGEQRVVVDAPDFDDVFAGGDAGELRLEHVQVVDHGVFPGFLFRRLARIGRRCQPHRQCLHRSIVERYTDANVHAAGSVERRE